MPFLPPWVATSRSTSAAAALSHCTKKEQVQDSSASPERFLILRGTTASPIVAKSTRRHRVSFTSVGHCLTLSHLQLTSLTYRHTMAGRQSIAAPEAVIRASQPQSCHQDQESNKDHCPTEIYPNVNTASLQLANGNVRNRTQTGLKSEHGHALGYVRPMTQHPGTSVATFFSGLFTTVIGISSLGTSVTFSYVLSNNTSGPRSAHPVFSTDHIQLFLAISWLLFLLALATAALSSTILTFFKEHWTKDWDGVNGKTSQFDVQVYAVFVAGLMGVLIIGAFVLLTLVVVAYSPIVGWVALGFTAFYGFVIAVGILHQFPWPWRSNTPTPGLRHSDS